MIKTHASTPDMAGIPSHPAADDEQRSNLPPTYPDLDVFNFLPELYMLIGRLKELKNSPSTNGLDNGINGTELEPTTSRESNNSLRMINSSESNAIETRDLPTHIYNLKKRIEEAKEAVHELPDIQRTIAEQEEEMKLLKVQIAGLSGRLQKLGSIAAQETLQDTEMEGVVSGSG